MTQLSALPRKARSGATPTDDPTSRKLSHLMPALWRTLLRATRDSGANCCRWNRRSVSILRRLSAVGPMSPAQLAEELRVALDPRSAICLKGLVSEGIVARERSESDGRAA